MKLVFAVLRVVVAISILAAIVAQLQLSLHVWQTQGVRNVALQVVNFFSFFTIDSNVASVVILAIGAGLLLAGRTDVPRYTLLRAIVVSYMVVTGIVYNLLLRGIELPQGSTVPWSNEILHVVGPLYLLLDWLFAPGRSPLPWRSIRAIVVFPIVWVVYTLVRGPFTISEITHKPWYPYPFLDPATSPEGYASVAFYVILIAVTIGATGAGVVWVSRRVPATPAAPAVPA
ncbi:hypothetical protein G3T37_12150 [Galbitalea soli]|uniref:Pr6Pr family membrane protein n=1 Tax=Galbitalea soli TaxID=1268042 RepID=A0A7C9PP57_9MICO|nr:hypothetical protein [Galbitalea soli]